MLRAFLKGRTAGLLFFAGFARAGLHFMVAAERSEAALWDYGSVVDEHAKEYHAFYLRYPTAGDKGNRHRHQWVGHAISKDLERWKTVLATWAIYSTAPMENRPGQNATCPTEKGFYIGKQIKAFDGKDCVPAGINYAAIGKPYSILYGKDGRLSLVAGE